VCLISVVSLFAIAAPAAAMDWRGSDRSVVGKDEVVNDDVSLAGANVIWGTDNVFKRYSVAKGDLAAAFARADLVVEGTYETGAQEQLYIEPQGMLATASAEAGITVTGSMQCPYYVQKALCGLFGLPGETEADFEETCRFVLDNPIDYAHVFKFSARPGTPAAQLPGRIEPHELSRRSTRLREISAQKRAQFHQRHQGHRMDVLFEQKSGGKWTGYTANYIRVAVASARDLSNQIAPVVLGESRGLTMTGVLDE
jgi:hypothetical protein